MRYMPVRRFLILAAEQWSDDECWPWDGRITNGYSWCGRTPGHRAAYELVWGPLQSGEQVDHLCRVKTCINPMHLEAVTHRENGRRWAASITHCPQGHEYTEANSGWRTQRYGRWCRECNRIRCQARVAAERKTDRRS